jgi:hypothetical protein
MAAPTNRVLTELNAGPTIRAVLEEEGVLEGDEVAAAASAAAAAESALRAEQYATLTGQILASAEAENALRAQQYAELMATVIDPETGFIHDELLPPIINCGTPTEQ